MDFTDLKTKSAEELKEILAEQKSELRELRFKALNSQLKQNHRVAEVRKIIARIQTLLHKK